MKEEISTRDRFILFGVVLLGIVVLVGVGFYYGWMTRASMP